jgi:hypothetical protein
VSASNELSFLDNDCAFNLVPNRCLNSFANLDVMAERRDRPGGADAAKRFLPLLHVVISTLSELRFASSVQPRQSRSTASIIFALVSDSETLEKHRSMNPVSLSRANNNAFIE